MPHGLGPTRARVLALLQRSAEPLSVSDIATELDLHRNSVRFHLDALETQGFVQHSVAATGHQGRPPLQYTATSDSPTIGSVHMMEMVEVLLEKFVAPSSNAHELALQAGRDWGDRVLQEDYPTDPSQVINALVRYFGERGFAASSTTGHFNFARCPFRHSVSDDVLPLVCTMHRGFVEGYLDSGGSPDRVASMEVGPLLCTVTLAPASSEA